jgi:hypothetical protein
MYSNPILHEVQQLYDVSDRLDSLAEQHPLVSEALIGISGSVRNTATLLEVLIAMTITPLFGFSRRWWPGTFLGSKSGCFLA